jgi:4-hydroxybenzoate polyprenyltransferase
MKAIAAWVAIASLYIAGMVLNDVADAAIDAVERPQRPIPSGRIPRRRAAMLAVALLLAGLGVLATISFAAVAFGSILVAAIIFYDLIHARIPGSVILMGLCRGMVYVVGAMAIVWTPNWSVLGPLAGALAMYTICFSIIARSENQAQLDQRRWIAPLLPFLAVTPVLVLHPANWPWVIVPLALVFGWLARAVGMVFASPPRTREAVMVWLSGMCLIDALYLALLDRPLLALLAMVCFGVTIVSQRRIAAT